MSDSTAQCWGANSDGQLGDDTMVDRSMPVTVLDSSGTAPLAGITQIATGGSNTCALLSNHTVQCWGSNYWGGLGIGTATAPETCGAEGCSALPVAVKNSAGTGPLSGVLGIAVGPFRACAVLSDHTLDCWGAAADFLDDGAATSLPTPVPLGDGITPLTNVANVTVGGHHTCALLLAGTAKCWGDGGFGALGNGSTSSSGYASFDVLGSSGTAPLTGITQISAGDRHTCALMSTGIVRCWGWNLYGQVGDNGSSSNRLRPSTVVLASNGLSLTQASGIVAVGDASCASLADGTARCWGSDSFWALGDGGLVVNQPAWSCGDCSLAALPVLNHAGTAPLSGIVDLAGAEGDHVCARANTGTVQCWGRNNSHQLGDGTIVDRCVAVTAGVMGDADLPPAPPQDVTATAGDREATVFWTPPPHQPADCRQKFDFSLTASPGGRVIQPINTYLLSGPGGTLGTVFPTLTAGVAYTFTVAATNQFGLGAQSAPSNSVTPTGIAPIAPDPPTNVHAVAGDRQVTVTWDAPADNGAPIIMYDVQPTTFAGGVGVSAPKTSATVQLLTDGHPYAFTVTATNSAGTSASSVASNTVTPDRSLATVPDPPTNVSASAGLQKAFVSWTAPVNDGLSAIGTYTITAAPGGQTVTAYPPATTATFNGLSSGTAYTFTMTATNDIGTSVQSVPSNSVTPSGTATVPDAPTIANAQPGNRQVALHWLAPANDGGSNITSYVLTMNPGGAQGTLPSSLTSYTFPNLTNGVAYTFTVRAVNAIGAGPDSAPATATPAAAPDPPTAVTVLAGSNAAFVMWQSPASDNGSAVTGYTVTTSPDTMSTQVAASQNAVFISGLVNGISYTVVVVALNAAGGSLPSAPSAAFTPTGPASVPGAPTSVHAARVNGSIAVSWTAPAANGAMITSYTVSESPGSKMMTVSGAQTHANFSLPGAGTYRFEVKAKNAIGTGEWSAASNPVEIVTAQNSRPRSGYWMLASNGAVYGFGNAASVNGNAPRGAVAIAPRRDGNGYWVVDATGNVSHFGTAADHGGHPTLHPGERVSTISATRSGNGYWLFTNRGRAFAYGDAHSYGDMTGVALNGPIVASVATPTGHGYYMVGSDGGVFSFGDAHFHGSTGNIRLNQAVVGISPTPDNHGYWLVASDGGVFAFDAPFRGSMGGSHLNRAVNGLVAYSNGYLMVASDGGVFDFSDKGFLGSLANNPPSAPIVGIAAFTTS